MERPVDFDIQKIIDTLQGTCGDSIDSALEFHYPGMVEEDLTDEDHSAIDNEIFVCTACGWWMEASQYGEEEGECEECSPRED